MFAYCCYATNLAWSVITFFGESVKGVFDKETNETYFVEVPRLPFKSYYPWNAMTGIAYMGTFAFQVNHTKSTPHGKTFGKRNSRRIQKDTHSNQTLFIL